MRLYWELIKEEFKANMHRNLLSYADSMLLFGSMMLLPVRILQNLTYTTAKRRSCSQWPQDYSGTLAFRWLVDPK
ncbi:hypothetical protein ACSVIJ_10385 [Pseudomonas sp. NCHU5208]|uniref:hypothetical protein n=1 Tax=unclassified Pseudomonas TaxID=196821 RepID=UPI003F97DA8A